MNNNEILEKTISALLQNIDNQLYVNIEAYNIKLKQLYKKRELELKNKPNKLFKKKYSEWIDKINKLDTEINNIYSKINKELKFIEKK